MITIFTQPGCGKCKVLKMKLDKKNIHYQINEDTDYMIKLGFKSTPQLMLDNGKILDFSAAVEWINNLED